jgi:hypothetical protein
VPHCDAQGFPVAFVDHVQGAEGPAVVQGVAHEVQRPDAVELGTQQQRLRVACEHTPLGLALEVQVQRAVHPVDAFVVPSVAILAQPAEALPEAPARALLQHGVDRVDHRRIGF